MSADSAAPSSHALLFRLQYLLEAGWAAEGKVVGVTQPRRVAAISVSLL